MDNKQYTQYNFQFAKSTMTQIKADGPPYKREVERPTEVRKIKLWFYKENALLRGFQLFDVDGNVLLQTGIDFSTYSSREYDVEKGERIVGFKSRSFTGKNANHHDF